MKTEAVTAVVKSAYPVGVATTTLFGATYQEWVYITAILWALLQSAHLIWKWILEWRERRQRPFPVPTVPESK